MTERSMWLGYQTRRAWEAGAGRERCSLGIDHLARHAFVCGSTGSGKTVFAKGLVEEAIILGVPVVAVDLKGDIASMALSLEAVDDHRVMASVFGDQADDVFREFRAGQLQDAQAHARAGWFDDAVDVRLFTPQSGAGRRVALPAVPSFHQPPVDEEESIFRSSVVAQGVARLGRRLFGKQMGNHSAEVKFLEGLAQEQARLGISMDGLEGIRTLMDMAKDPPFTHLGGLELDEFISQKQRSELRRRLSERLVGHEAEAFKGEVASMDTLLGSCPEGRTPLSIVYLAHLSDFDEQAAWIAHIATEVFSWAKRQGGSSALRVLLYIDEVGGAGGKNAFLPSYPHDPASKGPLVQLVKQGRSSGVGVLLATQNPISVDPRTLANVHTWAIGKLTQANDLHRLEGVLSELDWRPQTIRQRLSSPEEGQFLTMSAGLEKEVWVDERWLYCVHQQLSLQQIRPLAKWLGRRAATSDERPQARPPSPEVSARPVERPMRSAHGGVRAEPVEGPEERATTPTRMFDEEVPDDSVGREPLLSVVVEAAGQRIQVSGGEPAILGRSRSCALTLEDERVSRQHLAVSVDGNEVTLESLRVENPAILDGVPIRGRQTFQVQDLPIYVQVGKTEVVIVLGPG